MKVCIIGCRGHHGYVTAGMPLRPEARLTAVSAGTPEDTPETLLAAAELTGASPVVYDDYRVMLDKEAPDVACIAGPFEDRARMCIDAFQRGIHVFAEKPVAISEAQLTALETAHAASGVHFAAMMGLRYSPAIYTAWKAVQAGAVGEINLITAQKSYKLGKRPDYYCRRETYGGTIPWVGSHAIDWILWFSGRDFGSVTATQTRRHNNGLGSLEMAALCQFTLDDGALASASIDYHHPANAATHGDDRLRVAGALGVIEVRGDNIHYKGSADAPPPPECPRQIFADFLDHISGRASALITPAETFAVARACLLAQRSADTEATLSFFEKA